jgi:hypothetical protein
LKLISLKYIFKKMSNSKNKMEIGDKVKIIGGTHFRKKGAVRWGILKSKTKTFCRIDLHDYLQSKERGDPIDEVVVKEIQVASKFLEKVEELIITMPTENDLKIVNILPKEDEVSDVEMKIEDPVKEDASEFDELGLKKALDEEDEELWDGDGDDKPLSFQELDKLEKKGRELIARLQVEVATLQDELSGGIANMKCSHLTELQDENKKLRELLKHIL